MPHNDLIAHGDGIYAIDAHYVRPQLAAIHLIVEAGRAAFFDTGTNASLPHVLAVLARLNLAAEAVDYVIPSHVHLDHAGGAGAMMQAFPNARLVVHPRGARHMIDPTKLMAGTVAVYGEATTRRLYGELVPVPAERVVEATDGLVVDLAGRLLTVLDTPGHAKHHICLHDARTASVFTGDMFGLSYRELDVDGRPSVVPTTTPVQFDPPAMRASIERLLALAPQAMYLTHYSRVGDVPRLGADLLRLLDAHVVCARRVAAENAQGGAADRHARLVAALRALMLDERARQGWRIDDAALFSLLEVDIELNAQGLEVWLDSGA